MAWYIALLSYTGILLLLSLARVGILRVAVFVVDCPVGPETLQDPREALCTTYGRIPRSRKAQSPDACYSYSGLLSFPELHSQPRFSYSGRPVEVPVAKISGPKSPVVIKHR